MPRLDEPIKISSRPPWLDEREPFWRHQFVGGNTFMLALLNQNAKKLQPNAESAQFDAMIAKARQQLAKAANITVRGERSGDTAVVRVEVENLTGHKFPTGHPYRRAWLHVQLRDQRGRTIFESGAVDRDGRIRGVKGDFSEHHDLITQPGQVQIYESVMGDRSGKVTHALLGGATILKDNRLPPQGFRPGGPDDAVTAIRGRAAQDSNFNAAGNGRDEVTYRIAVKSSGEPLTAEVALLYQAVPPEAVEHLLGGRGPAAKEFKKLYSSASKTPEVVQRVEFKF